MTGSRRLLVDERATELTRFWRAGETTWRGLGFTTIAEAHGAIRRRDGYRTWTMRIRERDGQAELLLESGSRLENAAHFDRLVARRDEIESWFGARLVWDRREDRIRFRVACPAIPFGWRDHEHWIDAHRMLANDLQRLESAVGPYLRTVGGSPETPELELVRQDDTLPTDPSLRLAIERYAVETVLATLTQQFPGASIVEMPPNNPGFDLAVRSQKGVHLYVEVKGTSRWVPCFTMSENERRFSSDNSSEYELHVVWGIDVVDRTHLGVETRRGSVGVESHGLVVRQWRGQLEIAGETA